MQKKNRFLVGSFIVTTIMFLPVQLLPIIGQQGASANILSLLFGDMPRKPPSKTPFCSLFPNPDNGSLSKTASIHLNMIGNNPIFIWKNTSSYTAKEIIVFKKDPDGYGKIQIWKGEANQQQQLQYGKTNLPMEKLEIGKQYFYQIVYEDKNKKENKTSMIPFELVPLSFSEVEKQEFAKLSSLDKADSKQVVTLEQIKYLTKKQYYSDALQLLFSIENPTEDILKAIQTIRNDKDCSIPK